MRLTRVLTRSLGDFETLEVKRSWLIEFHDLPEGIVVSGKQSAVDVTAPAKLAALAEIEERRVEQGVFPLRLDRDGLIANEAEPEVGPALDQAVASAKLIIARQELTAERERETVEYLAIMQRSAQSLVSRLPRDLLYPQQLDWHEERALELPGGLRGEMSVRFSARICPQLALLEHSSRLVETRIGDSARLSSEEWLLSEA
jgi:hypothetical protein